MNNAHDTTEEILSNPELRAQLKAIVLERVGTMPDTFRIAIGSDHIEKKDLIEHIQDEDDIGKQMMAMELGFLHALTSGAIYTHE